MKKSTKKLALIISISVICCIGVLFLALSPLIAHTSINKTFDELQELKSEEINFLSYPMKISINTLTPKDNTDGIYEEELASFQRASASIEKAQKALNAAHVTSFILSEDDRKLIHGLQEYIDSSRSLNNFMLEQLKSKHESLRVVDINAGRCAGNMHTVHFRLEDIPSYASSPDAFNIGMIDSTVEDMRELTDEAKEQLYTLRVKYKLDVKKAEDTLNKLNSLCDTAQTISDDMKSGATDKLKNDVDAFNALYNQIDIKSTETELAKVVENSISSNQTYTDAKQKFDHGFTDVKRYGKKYDPLSLLH